MNTEQPVLNVKNLKAYIPKSKEKLQIINDVSFSINQGEIVALVGESGSGKSVTALSIMGLNTRSIHYSKESDISLKGNNLLQKKQRQMRKIRGDEISMIFQDPMSSLNPLHQIGKQIAEPIRLHSNTKMKAPQIEKTVIDLLKKVGIADAERRLHEFPHQLSGGMRQRVMIAMALACNPSLLIADEPTTALDVTIQAQILDVMKDMQKQTGISILLITHDLGVVAETADRAIVMYCGQLVEEADVHSLFESPHHPYTEGLMDSVPKLKGKSESRLSTIPGIVPSPSELPEGCPFFSRCSYSTEKCQKTRPPFEQVSSNRKVACWHPLNI